MCSYCIQLLCPIRFHVTTAQRELDPSLSFACFAFGIAQLRDEGSLVTTLPPGLGDVGRDGTRRPTDLVGQAIALFHWKALGHFKDCHPGIHRVLPNPQIAIALDLPSLPVPPSPRRPVAPSPRL